MPKTYVFTEYGGPETQELQDLPAPEPGPGEMRVRVRAAGVNPVDWKIRAGMLREVMPLDLPAVLGGEVAGLVEALGQDVAGFAAGDEVFGTTAVTSGGYAEYALVNAAEAAKKPTAVSFTDAAALPVAGATAMDAVRQLGLVEGQTLLITGIGGGVGVAAAQIARDAGVMVIGTASEDKRELVESVEATLVPSGDDVDSRVREILPDGVDAVLDLVGGQALQAVAGLATEPSRVVSTADPAVTELGGAMVERAHTGDVLAHVAAMVAAGSLDPMVSDVVDLEDAAEALVAVESGHQRGKLVLRVSG